MRVSKYILGRDYKVQSAKTKRMALFVPDRKRGSELRRWAASKFSGMNSEWEIMLIEPTGAVWHINAKHRHETW